MVIINVTAKEYYIILYATIFSLLSTHNIRIFHPFACLADMLVVVIKNS